MKAITVSFALCLAIANSTYAQSPPVQPPSDVPRTPSCTAESTTKKLAGAAKTSFMQKCETQSMTACDATASAKKLNGAAKTSFTKKCVTDSVGSN
jgi:hypothetical protein